MDQVSQERKVNFKAEVEEDELVKLQQQFLQRKEVDKNYVAAKLTKASTPNVQAEPEKECQPEEETQPEVNLRGDKLIPGLKSNQIVERDGNVATITSKLEDLTLLEEDSNAEQQQFANQFSVFGRLEEGSTIDKMLQDIHHQNLSKLASMTPQEILEAKQEILSTFDPEVVSSLLTLNRVEEVKTNSKGDEENEKAEEKITTTEGPSGLEVDEGEAIDAQQLELEPTTTEASLKAMKKTYFSNLSTEPEKLKWMVTQPTKTETTPKSGKFTRFDLEGLVVGVELGASLTVDLGLHHHGKEPELAGYTLEEISILTRSTVARQRSVALSLLTKIFINLRNGIYASKVVDEICRQFKSTKADNLIYNLRVCLDDTSNLVILHAVETLGALILGENSIHMRNDEDGSDVGGEEGIWNQLVNTSQGLEGISSASLNAVDVTQIEHEGDYQSIQYHLKVAAHDTLTGLLEMATLDRIQFLIERQPLTPKHQQTLLKMLIKLARHSVHSSQAIVAAEKLLESVSFRFLEVKLAIEDEATSQPFDLMGPKAPYPSSDAIKLLTLLSQNSQVDATQIIKLKGFQTCFQWLDPSLKTDRLITELSKGTWQLLRVLVSYDLLATDLEKSLQLATAQLQRTFANPSTDYADMEYQTTASALYFLEAATLSLYLHQDTPVLDLRWKLLRPNLLVAAQLLTKLSSEKGKFTWDQPRLELVSATLTFFNTCATLLNTNSLEDYEALQTIDSVPKTVFGDTNLFPDLLANLHLQTKAFQNVAEAKQALNYNRGWSSQLRRHLPSLGSKSELDDLYLFTTLLLSKISLLENILQLRAIYPNTSLNLTSTNLSQLFQLLVELVRNLNHFPRRYLSLLTPFTRLLYHSLQLVTVKLETDFPALLNFTFPLAVYFVTSVPRTRPEDYDMVGQVFTRWIVHPKLFQSLTVHTKLYEKEVVAKLVDLYFSAEGEKSVAGLIFDYEVEEQPNVLFSLKPLIQLRSPTQRNLNFVEDDAESRRIQQEEAERELERSLRCVQVTNLVYLILYRLHTSPHLTFPLECIRFDSQRDRFQLLRLTYLPHTRMLDVSLVTALHDLNGTLTQLSGFVDAQVRVPTKGSTPVANRSEEGEVKLLYDLLVEATENYLELGFNHLAYVPLLLHLPLTLDPHKFRTHDFRLVVWTQLVPNCTKATLQVPIDTEMLQGFQLGAQLGKSKFKALARRHPQLLLFFPVETDPKVLTGMADLLLQDTLGTKRGLVWNLVKHHLKFIFQADGKFKLETLHFQRGFRKLVHQETFLKDWLMEV